MTRDDRKRKLKTDIMNMIDERDGILDFFERSHNFTDFEVYRMKHDNFVGFELDELQSLFKKVSLYSKGYRKNDEVQEDVLTHSFPVYQRSAVFPDPIYSDDVIEEKVNESIAFPRYIPEDGWEIAPYGSKWDSWGSLRRDNGTKLFICIITLGYKQIRNLEGDIIQEPIHILDRSPICEIPYFEE